MKPSTKSKSHSFLKGLGNVGVMSHSFWPPCFLWWWFLIQVLFNTDTHRHTHTHTDTHRHTQTHTDTHRHTQTHRHTDTDTDTDTHTHTHRA